MTLLVIMDPETERSYPRDSGVSEMSDSGTVWPIRYQEIATELRYRTSRHFCVHTWQYKDLAISNRSPRVTILLVLRTNSPFRPVQRLFARAPD
jgi:hypothetical protein